MSLETLIAKEAIREVIDYLSALEIDIKTQSLLSRRRCQNQCFCR